MKVTFLVGQMRIHLDNLFNGNKVLGASLNMFLNQNAKEGKRIVQDIFSFKKRTFNARD